MPPCRVELTYPQPHGLNGEVRYRGSAWPRGDVQPRARRTAQSLVWSIVAGANRTAGVNDVSGATGQRKEAYDGSIT